MKLVGASNWFVRIPFMLEGLVQGVIGAAIAFGAVYGLKVVVTNAIARNSNFSRGFYLVNSDAYTIGLYILILGAAIGSPARSSGSAASSRSSGTCRQARRQGPRARSRGRVDGGVSDYLPGCATQRRYGFSDFQPSGNFSLAASSLTEPAMITSPPCCQLAGVATL